MRVAIYVRVSTEEQARHGLSVEAQLASLRKWAADNGHVIAGEYVEMGVSGRISPQKRPELQRLLSDIPAQKIALIAFTKLDRWTRNVKGYYQVQDVLEKYNVAWTAVLEDYETVSSSGRFVVNLLLAIAESESDRTSERIRTVFERKRERGEFTGRNVSPGYRIVNKRVEIDPDAAEIVRGLFQQYADEGSVHAVKRSLQRQGYPYSYQGVRALLENRLYIGEYRGIPDFCPALIERAVFDRVQEMLSRNVRPAPSGRVYLFSGLVTCAVCGARMTGNGNIVDGKLYQYYRCPNARDRRIVGVCNHTKGMNEDHLEAYLVANVAAEIGRIEHIQKQQAQKKKRQDPAAVKAKLERLKELYVEGMIEKAEYIADHDKLAAQLQEAEPAPAISAARVLVTSDFAQKYETLSREDRKALWRSAIREIRLDAENNATISFC